MHADSAAVPAAAGPRWSRDYLQVCGAAEIVQRLARTQGVCDDLLAQWESSAVEEVARIEAGVRLMSCIRVRGRGRGGEGGQQLPPARAPRWTPPSCESSRHP